MISPVARLQIRLGILPVFEPRGDFAPSTEYPDAWDYIPVRQYSGPDLEPTGVQWVDRDQVDFDQPEALQSTGGV